MSTKSIAVKALRALVISAHDEPSDRNIERRKAYAQAISDMGFIVLYERVDGMGGLPYDIVDAEEYYASMR